MNRFSKYGITDDMKRNAFPKTFDDSSPPALLVKSLQ